MTPNIVQAKKITGYMDDADLLWLAEQAQSHRLIVEIGSYLGRSTRALADNTPGMVIAIDDWYGPRTQDDRKALPPDGSGMTKLEGTWTEAEREALYPEFCRNLGDRIAEGRVVPLRGDHRNLTVVDFTPDMVFIDGEHTVEAVSDDIRFWQPRLAAGGLLCGHDIDQENVRRAVGSLLTFRTVPGTLMWVASA